MKREQILRVNDKAIAEFRRSGGRLASFGDAPVLLLTTTGARSGQPRTSPLMYLQDDSRPDTVYVFASAGGSDHDPAWFRNLLAHPHRVRVEIGSRSTSADVQVLSEPDRSAVFDAQASRYSGFAHYQSMTARPIAVVALTVHATPEPTFPAGTTRPRQETSMKAVRYHQYGDAGVLRYEDTERPTAGPGEVVVRVAATTFNPVEAPMRAGYLRQAFALRLPHTPGLDVAGTVEQVGAGVVGTLVGDQVIGFLPMGADGAAAELVRAPADVVTPAPRSIPLHVAAALPSAGLSAWQALYEHADLRPGQRILINGAGGAVGGYAVQLAHRTGAFVIATASPRSTETVRRQGADEIIDHTRASVTAAVTDPVDVVLNLVPLSDPAELLSLINPGGVFVTTVPPEPGTGGRDVRTAALFVRSDREQLAGLVELVEAGTLTVDVGETVPLADLAAVHTRSEAGTLRGKVVLTP